VDLTVDPDIDHFDTAHDGSAQIDAAESGPGKVNGAELRTCQVDPLETRAAQVILGALSHGPDTNHACRRSHQRADLPRMVRGCRVPEFGLRYPKQ
jgi:hypothetical protein